MLKLVKMNPCLLIVSVSTRSSVWPSWLLRVTTVRQWGSVHLRGVRLLLSLPPGIPRQDLHYGRQRVSRQSVPVLQWWNVSKYSRLAQVRVSFLLDHRRAHLIIMHFKLAIDLLNASLKSPNENSCNFYKIFICELNQHFLDLFTRLVLVLDCTVYIRMTELTQSCGNFATDLSAYVRGEPLVELLSCV